MTAVKQAACFKAAVSRGPATSNDLSPRRVLDHGMTHMMTPDEQRRRLTSGADLHCTRLRDTTVRSRVATCTSVLPVLNPHCVGQAASAIPAQQVRTDVFTATSPRD